MLSWVRRLEPIISSRAYRPPPILGTSRWLRTQRSVSAKRARSCSCSSVSNMPKMRLRTVEQVDIGAVDRPHAVLGGDLGELHRAGDRVVIGQRERLVAQLTPPPRELFGQRGAVEERIGRVAVQLDVGACGHLDG